MIIQNILQNGMKIGIDTAPLIYLVENHPIYFNRIFFIMEMISKRQISAISTMLTLTEVLTQPLKTKNLQLVQKYQSILNSSVGFDLIPINKTIAYKAAELRAQYNLKTPDAIQISTSIESRCNAFLTNDKGLMRVNEIQVLVLDDLSLT